MGDLTQALADVEDHADERWKVAAYRAVCLVAEFQSVLTPDDVWNLLLTVVPEISTPEPRALGPIMMQAQREGIIEPIVSAAQPCPSCGTEKAVRRSRRQQRQRGDVAIYRSKVYV